MCGIIISALILMVLVKIIARDDAEPEFWPMAGVTLVVSLAGLGGQMLLGEFGGLLGIVVLTPALVYACEISWGQALIVTVLYIVVQVALVFLLAFMFASA